LVTALERSSRDSGPATDAELILRAYRQWGLDSFSRIEGDFAVAIWDGAKRRLVLARDVIGARPLHFLSFADGIAFASLPLPLASLLGPPAPDYTRLASYLAGYPEGGSRSYFQSVERVMPAHCAIVEPGGRVRQQSWWTPKLTFMDISFEDAVEAVTEELSRTIGGMLDPRREGTAGDLSSGLDSSLIVATAADLLDDPRDFLALTAVAAGPVDSRIGWFTDEGSRASETAAMAGVRHIVNKVQAESPLAALERWFPTSQAPIMNACNLGWGDANYAAAARAGATTYLNGMRGNFTVTRPGTGRVRGLVRSGQLRELRRELAAIHRNTGTRWPPLLRSVLGHLTPDPLRSYINAARGVQSWPEPADMLLRPGGLHVNEAAQEARRAGFSPDNLAAETPEARMRDIHCYDSGAITLSVRARHGLNLREPMASRRLIELCLRLPPEVFFGNGETRRLGRRLLEGKAPMPVIRECDRGLQGANWRSGYEPARGAMLREIELAKEDPHLSGMINLEQIKAEIKAWPTSNWSDPGQLERYRNRLFRPIGAARFARFVRGWQG
jgi:asparagine synthase (glutamine-hydrolysing)